MHNEIQYLSSVAFVEAPAQWQDDISNSKYQFPFTSNTCERDGCSENSELDDLACVSTQLAAGVAAAAAAVTHSS